MNTKTGVSIHALVHVNGRKALSCYREYQFEGFSTEFKNQHIPLNAV